MMTETTRRFWARPSDVLFDALVAQGLDANRPVFVSWLGVTPYLTPDAMLETLRTVAANSAPTSGPVL